MITIPARRALKTALQITLAAGVALGATHAAHASYVINLSIPGIEGESFDVNHKGEIQVLVFEEAIGSRKVCPEYTITKFVDKASPLLAEAANKGIPLATATLTIRKAGEGQRDFYKLTMTSIAVLGLEKVVSTADAINEKVVISPKAATTSYKPQDDKGVPGGDIVGTVTCP